MKSKRDMKMKKYKKLLENSALVLPDYAGDKLKSSLRNKANLITG